MQLKKKKKNCVSPHQISFFQASVTLYQVCVTVYHVYSMLLSIWFELLFITSVTCYQVYVTLINKLCSTFYSVNAILHPAVVTSLL